MTSLPSVADVTERLLLEFEATHGLRSISGVIRSCRMELRNTVPADLPASLEALVRIRLAVSCPLSAETEAGAA